MYQGNKFTKVTNEYQFQILCLFNLKPSSGNLIIGTKKFSKNDELSCKRHTKKNLIFYETLMPHIIIC